MAVVAHGEQGADGDLSRGGAEMNVHIEGGEGEGFALFVGGNGSCDGLACSFWRSGPGGSCGLSVVIDGAREDDLAVRLLIGCGSGCGRGGCGSGLGERGDCGE